MSEKDIPGYIMQNITTAKFNSLINGRTLKRVLE